MTEETQQTHVVETPTEAYSSGEPTNAPVTESQDAGVKEIIIGSDITAADRDIIYERLVGCYLLCFLAC